MDITVRYSCLPCGLRDAPVNVPAREIEDVVAWLEATVLKIGEDHRRRSPACQSRHFDMKIPLFAGSATIGGPQLQ